MPGADRVGYPARVEIVLADLDRGPHRRAILEVLSAYAEEPVVAGRPLPEAVRHSVLDGLRAHPTTEIVLAFEADRPLGMAVCFVSFSTFRARRVLNIHDLAVVASARGRGVGRALLGAVEARALALGCCKLTLEVREDNRIARGLYQSFGFADFAPGEVRTPTFFLEKPIGAG